MDILRAIKGRRSIRSYEKKEVKESLIKKIVDEAIWAPSACNRQGWRIIWIKHQITKEKLVANGTAFFVKNAPVLLLILYDNRTDNQEYKDYIQSASAFIQNFHLIAYSKGLGSCWVNNLPSKRKLRSIFKIPLFYEPIALVTLGYPDKNKPPKKHKRIKNADEIISKNFFSFNEKDNLKNKTKLAARKLARKIYSDSPKTIKNFFEPLARKFERRFD